MFYGKGMIQYLLGMWWIQPSKRNL